MEGPAMKALALIPIAGALLLFGSAFTGVWTAPGLELLPTYDSILKNTPPKHTSAVAGVTAFGGEVQFQASGVTADWGDQPFVPLPGTVDRTSRPSGMVDNKPSVDRSSLPARWYTTDPVHKPKPTWPVIESTPNYYRGSDRSKRTSRASGQRR